MINTKDVLRMKVPYPSVSDTLAVKPHMYICKNVEETNYEFIKCQTLKPYMLTKNICKHYVDEVADVSRNPFQRATRIDCDKVFTTGSVVYSDGMKTTSRPDICQELYEKVLEELIADGFLTIPIEESDLVRINTLASWIS